MPSYTPTPDDNTMRKIGFTDHVSTQWYLCERVDSDTTFNLTVDKETGHYQTSVLNEFFLQPEMYYTYGKVEFRDKVISKINIITAMLNENGLNIVHDHKKY